MAVTLKDYNSASGVTYRHITDTQADWGDVPGGTYFFDLETKLPYYRDLQGYVIEVFTSGQSTGNVTTFANVDKQLISGGALWDSGMTFNVSNLTYSFDGTIQTTDGPSIVTLSVGDVSFDRIDAIVVNNDSPYGVVSVIEGQPASNPGTPEIPFDKLLVQYIIVATGATSIAVNQDIIYDENTEWTGSVADSTGLGTFDFESTTPTPQEGTKCLRVTDNNRRRWARFTRTSPITSSDYTSISGYFYAEEYSPNRRLYIRFRSGTSYVGNGVYVTNTFASTSISGIWQQFTVPLYLFNLAGDIDGIDILYTASSNSPLNNWALDFVRLQGGFNPAQITPNNSNIYNSNGSLTANRTVDQGSFELLFNGDQNSNISHRITSTLNPGDTSYSSLGLGYTAIRHRDLTNGLQGSLSLVPGNSYMSVSNLGTNTQGIVSFNGDQSSLSYFDGIAGTREIKVDVDGISINNAYTFPNNDGSSGQVMTTDGSGQLSFSTPSGGGIGGTGTTNYVPRWTDSTTLSSTSRIWDNGTFVGIGATTQSGLENLRITGITRIDDALSYLKLDSGNVTYENTTSSANLDVLSSGGGISLARVNIIGATAGWGRISYGKTGNTQKLDIFNNLTSAAVITLTSSDNVGIGTASPSGKAHIVAASNNASVLVLDGLNDNSLFGENISITKQADVQSTGVSTEIAATIPLASGKRIVCEGRFIAQEVTPSTVTVGGNFMFVAANIGGTITIIGDDVSLKENSAGTPTVTFDGVLGSVRIKATGGGETLSWLFTYTYEIISQPSS